MPKPIVFEAERDQGNGVALAPPLMFARPLESGRIVRPFAIDVTPGGYWLTLLKSKHITPGMRAFHAWIWRSAPSPNPPLSDTP
ncbi:hypothetical protein D3877_00795 [Azospirillum cavernae]|uniref:LysR substrate-binding domain-containing protein n=1 Tax=Azospirillum cavernae TaxID=2320860 RepID=A0A418VZW2_9PROT|nr:LysR substrate-binding domain-containing protein [Azospirillum cavernae]RJF83269.1 hypothetical protein D3877_00795 [Azospirillum cavernae]